MILVIAICEVIIIEQSEKILSDSISINIQLLKSSPIPIDNTITVIIKTMNSLYILFLFLISRSFFTQYFSFP